MRRAIMRLSSNHTVAGGTVVVGICAHPHQAGNAYTDDAAEQATGQRGHTIIHPSGNARKDEEERGVTLLPVNHVD